MRHFLTIIIACTVSILLQLSNGQCGITTISYDQSGRLVSVNYAGPGSIQYRYDTAGNIEEIRRTAGDADMVDIDGDGIDDNWEILHFENLTTASSTSDFDKDGYTDLQEYRNFVTGETDPKGAVYDPRTKNAPSGTGHIPGGNSLPGIFMLLLEE